jgi:hypothetical protein
MKKPACLNPSPSPPGPAKRSTAVGEPTGEGGLLTPVIEPCMHYQLALTFKAPGLQPHSRPEEPRRILVHKVDVTSFRPSAQQYPVGVLHQVYKAVPRAPQRGIVRILGMALPSLRTEIVPQVRAEDYPYVVELETCALWTQPIWSIPFGSSAQSAAFGIPGASFFASGRASQGLR